MNKPTCDCFKALTPVESSCKFNDANAAAKAAKDKCFKSDTPGSFGDCSGALKKASGKIGKCGLGVGTGPVGTTTKSARNPKTPKPQNPLMVDEINSRLILF